MRKETVAELQQAGATPLYVQLADTLRQQVEQGALPHGSQIPSEAQLMQTYDISRVTVRKAVEQLVEEGVLHKRQGKGTFVAFPEFTEGLCGESASGSFTDTFLNLNMVPGTRIVAQKRMAAGSSVARRLGIQPEDEIVYISRVRYVNNYPAVFEEDFFPLHFSYLLEMDLENKSLLSIINEKSGVVPAHFHDTFQARLAANPAAHYLEVSEGEPLLRVSQIILNKAEEVLYYNIQMVRSDVYKYTVKSR